MKAKFAALIEVRKLITFAIVGLFVAMSLMGMIGTNTTENVIIMVITYYFAKSNNGKGDNL